MKTLAFLLISVCLAKAGPTTQRGAGEELPPPPPPGDLLQSAVNLHLPFPDGMLQREVIPEMSVVEQREVLEPPFLIHGEPQARASLLLPRGRRPSSCSDSPSCHRLNDFPPGRPTASNIANICLEGRTKPSYGPWNLPQTGFSHLSRQGEAINNLEAGLAQCCQRPQEEKVRCALGEWKDALEEFCLNEFSVKTKHYRCCKQQGVARDRCFANDAPNPNYDTEVTDVEAPPACSSSECRFSAQVAAQKLKLPALSFPPGKPTATNMANICKLHKFRPLYPQGTLPQTGYGWFQRQARAINRLEGEFKKCCRKEDAGCTHKAWEKVLAQFCKQEMSVKTKHHPCCKENDREVRYSCFADRAPYPAYDKEIQTVSLAEVTSAVMDVLCGHVKLFTKQRQIPGLIQNMTETCCDLHGKERTQCAEQEMWGRGAMCSLSWSWLGGSESSCKPGR
uniref:Extracellular matrix protein 1 n=1 Tax=Sphenodon punctatus TaxID=8508 RepID=A0A8D0L1H5_SPHPU